MAACVPAGPTQFHAIAIWSALFVTILQGLQIDTDHWRQFCLMLGPVWGLAAVQPSGDPSRQSAPQAP